MFLGRCHGAGCKDKSFEDALFVGDKRAPRATTQSLTDDRGNKFRVYQDVNLWLIRVER